MYEILGEDSGEKEIARELEREMQTRDLNAG